MSKKKTRHVIVTTDRDSGWQGLYVDGELVDQDDAIYACDIVSVVGKRRMRLSHVSVSMPEDISSYPRQFGTCMLWNPELQED